jgi:hypothetical protein
MNHKKPHTLRALKDLMAHQPATAVPCLEEFFPPGLLWGLVAADWPG